MTQHDYGQACICATATLSKADLGYLKLAASEAIAARAVLRNSYIAGFSLPWGDRRRCNLFECGNDSANVLKVDPGLLAACMGTSHVPSVSVGKMTGMHELYGNLLVLQAVRGHPGPLGGCN